MTLYDMSNEWQLLIDEYYAAEPEERNAVLARIDELAGNIEDKADAYARLMKNTDGEITALKAEIKRLQDMKQSREMLVERLKSGILNAMIITGSKEIKTAIGSWKVQKNPYSCRVVDRDAVPERFRVLPDPDEWKVDGKAAIAEFKETGELLDGLIIEQAEGIRFR